MTLNDIRFLNTSDIYGFIFYLAENHNSIGTTIKKIEHLRTFFDFLYKIKTALFKEPLKTIKREKNRALSLMAPDSQIDVIVIRGRIAKVRKPII